MRRISFLASALSLFACNPPNCIIQAKVGKIQKVIILGNSIVQHPPLASIGWNNNWGMAASSLDSDFVHRLIKSINDKSPGTTVQFKNIADFEREFAAYDLHQLDSLKGADMYIFRLSENVANYQGFIEYYRQLINYLNSNNAVIVIVDGFWDKPVNKLIRKFAYRNKYAFILNSDLQKEKSNSATGLYHDAGICVHPSDKGMLAIKERIWDYIKGYF